VKGENGKMIVYTEGKKRVWKGYFEGLGRPGEEEGKFDEEFRKDVEIQVKKMVVESANCYCEKLDGEILITEVKTALDCMKNGKAAGEDGILTEFLKAGGEPLVIALVRLFNLVWKGERVPVEWGRGMIVPL
jgi:hypothetical protein